MNFSIYPILEQGRLTEAIRANANQHQATAVHLWRTALEQVNPQVLPIPPYCLPEALLEVYDRLDAATMPP